MPGLDISLNGKEYVVVPNDEGIKVATSPVQQFIQPIRSGRTRPEDTAPYESFVISNLINGFGANKYLQTLHMILKNIKGFGTLHLKQDLKLYICHYYQILQVIQVLKE